MNTALAPPDYQPTADCLRGKNILVTGAGDGIGRAAAKCFADHGATLLLLGRTASKLEAVYDEIEADGNPKPAVIEMDLATAEQDSYHNLADALAAEFGHLDGLLHNAALLGERTTLQNASFQKWQEVMHVNVHAQFMLTQAMMPLLQQAPNASIVLTSSGVGREGRAYWGAYAVSKFATEGYMQVLAQELENTSRVRVNSLNPKGTNTAMRRSAYPAENPASNPSPEDIMPAYLFLIGDDSLGVTGQAFDAR